MLLSYMAAGRGGEVATVSWPLVNFSYALDSGVFIWGDQKKSKQYPVPMITACESPYLDTYFIHGCAATFGQFVRGGPAEYGEAKLWFPQFASSSGNATKVSRMLQDCASGTTAFKRVDICHGNPKLTSHSFSHGTMAEMGAAGVHPLNQCDLKGHASGGGGGGGGGADGLPAAARFETTMSPLRRAQPLVS
jgi:hypothetical protein